MSQGLHVNKHLVSKWAHNSSAFLLLHQFPSSWKYVWYVFCQLLYFLSNKCIRLNFKKNVNVFLESIRFYFCLIFLSFYIQSFLIKISIKCKIEHYTFTVSLSFLNFHLLLSVMTRLQVIVASDAQPASVCHGTSSCRAKLRV